ncbi:hypothetical protein [Nocardia sp. CDC160]|uniref:hypothetical protein n=1 Tax=Nocardia sp. CDC160 TaxID=3112166 RepID=UPI002DB8995D|nr:hypothetical protein [Nocardia sp. CDC160]MEC3920314.1 hypothetical protein [Nocardia sp. CDC160]
MGECSTEQVCRIVESNVGLAIEFFDLSDVIDVGLSRESLQRVEDVIERIRAAPGWDPEPEVVADLALLVGSLLGECVAVDAVGQWSLRDSGVLGVELPNGEFFDPFHVAQKAIRQGVEHGESIVRFHCVMVDRG